MKESNEQLCEPGHTYVGRDGKSRPQICSRVTLMPDVAGLLEVEPFTGDTAETVRYRTCDLCEESICEDIWEKRPERAFYFDPEHKLSVCENCTAEYLTEKPS